MKPIVCLIVAVIFTLFSLSKTSADSEFERMSLWDLPAVGVVIEDLAPGVERSELTKGRIRTDVELKLRLAGIEVLSNEELLKTPGLPLLRVSVTVITRDENYPTYVYMVDVGLNQIVYLERLWDSTLCCEYSLDDILNELAQLEDSNLVPIWWSRCRQTHKLSYSAYTWSTSGVGHSSNIDDIRGMVKDYTDDFINAWLSFNSKGEGN